MIRNLTRTLVGLFGLAVCCSSLGLAQERGSTAKARDSKEIKTAWRPLIGDACKATVRIKCGGKDTELGTIVGADGWIITKASELRTPIAVKLSDGKEYPAKLVGLQAAYDLAMLKVEASGLPIVNWSPAKSDPSVGQFLATASTGEEPLAIGVVSVPRRKIPGRSGYLGVSLDESDYGPKITQVFPGSGAEKAGLLAGDIVKKVADQIIKNRENLQETIRSHKPGDTLKLAVVRGEQEIEVNAVLSIQLPQIGQPGQRQVDQNTMGGPLSTRNADFPNVLQHDTALRPIDCGGPVVDLSGKVVGVNIARGGRVESYAVPTDILLAQMYDLMSGKLAPKDPPPPAEEPKKPEVKKPEPEKKPAEPEKKPDEKKPDEKKPEEKKPSDPPKPAGEKK